MNGLCGLCYTVTLQLISCCVTDNVDEELLKVLIDSACLLIASKAREVVQSALGFVKTLLLSFSANFGLFLSQVVSVVLETALLC